MTAEQMGVQLGRKAEDATPPPQQSGERLEHSPILTLFLAALAAGGWCRSSRGRAG
ncbi:hypothetical protein [Dankookia rubra]|uniref:hypothetical protein n=1 Tax=Dankookia rubra TaxID=1442381 RepID=UPI001F4F4B80|nr:hypothetical protein [Dankookia rubra]